MFCKKKIIAMLLAGGQGSRLCHLTEKKAKPAVSFGGKYRIVDFALSNCINSGIDTVGVLTQYQPMALNGYMGNGAPWDLDRMQGGLTVLPPYLGKDNHDWYRGTANAIYQNVDFIRKYMPDYVLILSADHIYQMDYSAMLKAHEKSGAACTVATFSVEGKEASRFGICSVSESGFIELFEEKPKEPKSNRASMGIYIFNTDILLRYLSLDESNPDSSNDFGKNIFPLLIDRGEKVYAYPFHGYFKDVGTVKSLWEANMDLLGASPVLDLSQTDFPIHSRNPSYPPLKIGQKAVLSDCIFSDGCIVEGNARHSVFSEGVILEEGAFVDHSVIMANVRIRKGAKVEYCIVDRDATVGENVHVGDREDVQEKITVVGEGEMLKDRVLLPMEG